MDETLIARVSRSMFWNIAAFPLSMLLNAGAQVYLIRYLGTTRLNIFAILVAAINTITAYSSLGISRSLNRFLPEFKKAQNGVLKIQALLRTTFILRLSIITISIVILNLYSSFFIRYFELGTEGPIYIKIISIAVIFTGLYNLATYLLHSLFRQKEVNIIALIAAFIQPTLLITFILVGLDISGILLAIVLSNMVACALSWYWGIKALPSQKIKLTARKLWIETRTFLKRFFSYSSIVYLFDMSKYFRDLPFATIIILTFYFTSNTSAKLQVSFFFVGFKLVDSAIKFLTSASRGVFTPMTAEVYAEKNAEKLHKIFWNASKFQVLICIPAAFGLMLLTPNLIPVLFKEAFAPSINIAYILTAFLFLETLIAFPSIILLTYEKYRYIIISRLIPILGIPLLIIGTRYWGGVGAAFCLGSLGIISRIVDNYFAISRFKLKYPFKFLFKIIAASAIFTSILALIRWKITISPYTLALLIVLGGIFFIIAFKMLGGFSQEEKEVIEKSSIPFKNIILKIT